VGQARPAAKVAASVAPRAKVDRRAEGTIADESLLVLRSLLAAGGAPSALRASHLDGLHGRSVSSSCRRSFCRRCGCASFANCVILPRPLPASLRIGSREPRRREKIEGPPEAQALATLGHRDPS
jgi:hypothetical protein